MGAVGRGRAHAFDDQLVHALIGLVRKTGAPGRARSQLGQVALNVGAAAIRHHFFEYLAPFLAEGFIL